MPGLTEHLVLPPGGEYRPAVVPEILDDHQAIPAVTRDQQRRAATVVLNHLGDGDDARTVVAMLCQPVRTVTAVHSEKRDHGTVMRREYLGKVRRWAIENGVPLGAGGYVTRAAQARYDRAQAGGAP